MSAAPTPPPEPYASKYARKVAARRERDRDSFYVDAVHRNGMFARPPYYIRPAR